ncbi:hypothetical protein [[Mycobacterium] zoologicum]|uniref:hypothetical protein n=1 Tax=[Mycobacterium] zoologicum TaxID=2872311 RepID=UPI001CDA948E|nr:hypothetical protein [Mycolicibacter sp. MYC101]MEB3065331.1 hypothetical protein [Mycolicibacter sp. MYC101]
MELFACGVCGAAAESVSQGRAVLAVVRHAADCSVLAAQVRARYAVAPTGLPESPRQRAFEQRASFGGWRRTVDRLEAKRQTAAVVGRSVGA